MTCRPATIIIKELEPHHGSTTSFTTSSTTSSIPPTTQTSSSPSSANVADPPLSTTPVSSTSFSTSNDNGKNINKIEVFDVLDPDSILSSGSLCRPLSFKTRTVRYSNTQNNGIEKDNENSKDNKNFNFIYIFSIII